MASSPTAPFRGVHSETKALNWYSGLSAATAASTTQVADSTTQVADSSEEETEEESEEETDEDA